MMRFEVTVTGLGKAARIVEALHKPMKDMRPIWRAIRPVLQDAAEERFETQGTSDGQAWAPLTPAYAARKNATHPGRGILVRDGALRDSLTLENGPGQIYRETSKAMVWGTSDPKAPYHQHGTGRMPAREVLRVTARDEKDIEKAADKVFHDAARGAGYR